ncbi:hypothetical protein Taro_014546 [Colocasia esculenta]|uniref:CCHC-type domain-containing protein n=1 Tax=Colocasia esculenta TaxID=4460 RepID=A0A843U9B9_COLES|nr:hypothetical protein [Colocasia esculenta]
MAKVEGMRGKDNSKPVFVKRGAPNIAPTFRNNNVNNNNKRPNAGRDVAGDKRVKMEGRQLAENCKFCEKRMHRAEECWKKLGACLKCEGRDHRIPDCPMLKDQPGRAQNVPRCQGRLNAVIEADLPEEGGMVEVFTQTLGTSLKLAGVMWRSSWWLESRRSSIPSSSSSPVRLLRPAQTTFLESIKGRVLSPVATAHPSRSECDEHTVATSLPDLTAPSRSSHPSVAFCSRLVATLTSVRRDLTFGSDSHVAFFICTLRDLPA